MAQTLAEQLDETETAISKVLSGVQSYTDEDGHTVTYPDLLVLKNIRRDLKKEINRGDRHRVSVSQF